MQSFSVKCKSLSASISLNGLPNTISRNHLLHVLLAWNIGAQRRNTLKHPSYLPVRERVNNASQSRRGSANADIIAAQHP